MTITMEPNFFFVFVIAAFSLIAGACIGANHVYNNVSPVLEAMADAMGRQQDRIDLQKKNEKITNQL